MRRFQSDPQLLGSPALRVAAPWLDARAAGVLGVLAVLCVCGVAEAAAVYIWNPWITDHGIRVLPYALARVAYALVTGALVLSISQAVRPLSAPRWAPFTIAACGFLLSVAIANFVLNGFATSGDEYGYNYLANTFLHGRLWNPPVPQELRDVLHTFYIADRDGKRASQYPPGWPALLAGFRLAGYAVYANAIIGLATAGTLWLALRQIKVPTGVRIAAFTLVTLSPFYVFTNASYFSHSLTVACLVSIIWLSLRDDNAPSAWNLAGIGCAFSVLLTTRYEDFLIAFALFAVDGLIRKRARLLVWAAPAALAALPITALFLCYNWKVTGSPFRTTYSWADPHLGWGLHSTGIEGPYTLAHGAMHTAGWAMSWQDFASVLILPLYALALWRRVATRSLRWFDVLLPALVAFFTFYPDFGGFQFGPRYWYFGYAALPVTIAAGLPVVREQWLLGRWRFDPMRIALVQLASFAGFMIGYGAYLHAQTELRQTPFRVAATAPGPAVVLMSDTRLPYTKWQAGRSPALQSADYTRNGLNGFGPVIIGRDLGSQRTALLCHQIPDRRIFKLILNSPPPQGKLVPAC